MLNAKRKGTAREHRSIALLEAAGYRCTCTAVSLGAWDWPGAAEMETLKDFPCPLHCPKLVHRWRDRQRISDVREVL